MTFGNNTYLSSIYWCVCGGVCPCVVMQLHFHIGDSGQPGAFGTKGERGPIGQQGPHGNPGREGYDGQKGRQGKEGPAGSGGLPGDKVLVARNNFKQQRAFSVYLKHI